MTKPLGLRERKKQERRRCIEDAAIDLFEQHGFDNTTIEDIAAAADIAPRTFFYYFPTKEDVVLADYASRLERIIDELEQRPSTQAPWPALRAAFLTVASDYQDQRDHIARRFQIVGTTPSVYGRALQLQAGWEDAVTKTLNQRLHTKPDDIQPRLLAAAGLAAMRSALQHWMLTGFKQPLPRLVTTCFDQLASGLDEGTVRSPA